MIHKGCTVSPEQFMLFISSTTPKQKAKAMERVSWLLFPGLWQAKIHKDTCFSSLSNLQVPPLDGIAAFRIHAIRHPIEECVPSLSVTAAKAHDEPRFRRLPPLARALENNVVEAEKANS